MKIASTFTRQVMCLADNALDNSRWQQAVSTYLQLPFVTKSKLYPAFNIHCFERDYRFWHLNVLRLDVTALRVVTEPSHWYVRWSCNLPQKTMQMFFDTPRRGGQHFFSFIPSKGNILKRGKNWLWLKIKLIKNQYRNMHKVD